MIAVLPLSHSRSKAFLREGQRGDLSWSRLVLGAVASLAVGCGVIKEKPNSQVDEMSAVGRPMSNDQAKAVLGEVGSNFAYGPGLGDAAVNLGAVIVFPPYILYLLGNTALSLSGYEPVTVSSMLPEEQGKAWSHGYDTVVSGPGRVVAATAGREYRSREVGDERLRVLLADGDQQHAKARMKGT
ncbi:MAG: hypothetical protein RIS36_1213 [Pseudomonadota bacterium]|jgi:hypothetical protein